MANLATITGIAEVQAMLASAPKAVVARGYLKALQAASAEIENELYITTPERDEGERDESKPHLKDSMVTEIALDAQFRGGTAAIGFGANGHVALWVEYGHRMVGHKPGRNDLGAVAPHPFMRPAFDAAADRAVAAFAASLESTLRAGI